MTLTGLEMSLLGVLLGTGGVIMGKLLFANGKVKNHECVRARGICDTRLQKMEKTQAALLNWARYELQNKGMNPLQITQTLEGHGMPE